MPTRLTGINPLPKTWTNYKGPIIKSDLMHELFLEIGERYGDKIVARPHVKSWGLGGDRDNNEYMVVIFTDKPIKQIPPEERKELEKPVGDFRVKLEPCVEVRV